MPITRGKKLDVGQLDMAVKLDDDIIDITSGNLQGRLHRERFICPGINRECIEFMGQFVTPKAFYVMADKASLKDWKNAIRINGKKIRRYIDSGELDFYNHAELCTGRCKSRVPMKNSIIIDTSGELKASQMLSSLAPVVTTVSKINEHTYSSLPDHGEQSWKLASVKAGVVSVKAGVVSGGVAVRERGPAGDQADDAEATQDIKPSVEQLNHMMLLNLRPGKDGTSVALASEQVKSDDGDKMFWRAIVELGLVDEFFREIKSKLDVLKNNMIKNFVPAEDAKIASSIVNHLGLRYKLDLRLSAHKCDFDRQRLKLDREVEELKRKVSEYEKKQDVLKRKSDCYNQLLSKKAKTDDAASVMSYSSDSQQSDSQRCSSPGFLQAQMLKAQGAQGTALLDSPAPSPTDSQSQVITMENGDQYLTHSPLHDSHTSSPSASQESCPSQSSDNSSFSSR